LHISVTEARKKSKYTGAVPKFGRWRYYTKSFGQHFAFGLWGGRPGCPPRLFEAEQPGRQPPRLTVKKPSPLIHINRDGYTNVTATVNTLTEAVRLWQPPQLTED
jgi:hypothetical protein